MDFLVTLGSDTVCGSLRVTLLLAKRPAGVVFAVFSWVLGRDVHTGTKAAFVGADKFEPSEEPSAF